MTRKPTTAAPTIAPGEAPAPIQDELDGAHEASGISNYEFIDRVPTREEVAALLVALPPTWGVAMVDYLDYVQPLPQAKKYKRPHPTRPGISVEDKVDTYTLYVSVAGRQQMLRQAQEVNSWRCDVRPEPITPTGVPGYLSFAGRLVYRVYVDIYERSSDDFGAERLLGTRSGTAWVPESGGSRAAGSNPYEKVETSALGRAIGAWGFGVLPGSGIATVEEMSAIASNRAAISSEPKEQQQRTSREELLEDTRAAIEAYRQASGAEFDEMADKVGNYLVEKLGVNPAAYDADRHEIGWPAVKDGQLMMLLNMLRQGISRLEAAATFTA